MPNPPGVVMPSARQADVLQDLERVRHVVRDLIDTPSGRPIPVLHELQGMVRVRMARLRVDHAGVRDHLGMDVPVGHHERPDQLDACGEFPVGPSRQLAVQPAHAGRVRDDAVLAFHTVIGAPLAERADERVGNLHRPFTPLAQVALVRAAECGVELRHREPVEVHEARRVVDDEADRHAAARVEHRDAVGARGPFARDLGAAPTPRPRQSRRAERGLLQEAAAGRWAHHIVQCVSP